MTNRKISELPDFVGKQLLLEAQRRGVKETRGVITEGAAVTLIGLAIILVERGILLDGSLPTGEEKK